MFGGGYAMIAALDHELVGKLQWLTASEFADAIALSQITPGPIATAAAFFGYRLAGIVGAAVATVAVFLPSYMLTVLASGCWHALARGRLSGPPSRLWRRPRWA